METHSLFQVAKLTKENIPFTQVANVVITSPTISFKAKGIFSYLFSKPPGWKFSGDRISKKESKDGRKSIYAGLKELENHGYLSREKEPNGRMIYILKYSVDEKPVAQKGKEPKRQTAERGSISNTYTKSNKEEESNTLVGKADEVFNFQKELLKLKDSDRRDMKIIALYWRKKGFSFENQEQFNAMLKRDLRPAKDLKGYTGEQIARAIAHCAAKYGEWTLETVGKRISDVVNRGNK